MALNPDYPKPIDSDPNNPTLKDSIINHPEQEMIHDERVRQQKEEAKKEAEVNKAARKEAAEAKEAAAADNYVEIPDTVKSNVFYIDVKVFIEGVQVPHSSAGVSYGVGQPPTATIIIPASAFMRDLPETTKVLIIFKDLLPDATGQFKYRVLFDGEMSGLSYSISAYGAQMSIQAVHTTAYLSLMQVMTQAAAQFLYNPNPRNIGDFVIPSFAGYSQVKTNIIDKVISGKGYESMADVVYLILRNILEAYKDSSAISKWYWQKLGNEPNGYKILERIYGVSDTAKAAALVKPDLVGKNSGVVDSGNGNSTTTTTNKASSYGDENGSSGPNGTDNVKGRYSKFTATPVAGTITSYVGNRNTGISGASTNHQGVDIAVPEGTEVRFTADAGIVLDCGTQTNSEGTPTGYGKWVEIEHADGSTTLYAHLSNNTIVRKGDTVTHNQVIALSGNTGTSSGAHLHWEFHDKNGVLQDPLDYVNPDPDH